MNTISRWPSGAAGRSRTVRHGDTAPFADQVVQSLAMLESHLLDAGSSRWRILSIQVLLADIGQRPEFDRQWVDWIGGDPDHWPQRACYQAAPAPGPAIEPIVVAACDTDAGET